MEIPGKEVPEEFKALGLTVEEGVNKIKDSTTSTHQKAPYKRYSFDFYKPSGGMDKIPLMLP